MTDADKAAREEAVYPCATGNCNHYYFGCLYAMFDAGWEAARQAALQHILRENASLLKKLADLDDELANLAAERTSKQKEKNPLPPYPDYD